jgi:hypothetical protein
MAVFGISEDSADAKARVVASRKKHICIRSGCLRLRLMVDIQGCWSAGAC